MRPFIIPDGVYTSSVALDASTIQGVTVAVASYASRRSEVRILERLCRRGEDVRFKPFATKARDYDRAADRDFFEGVLSGDAGRLRGLHHVHSPTADTHRIEGVLSALLVDEILDGIDGEPLVLLDGDSGKLRPFARALSALRTSLPGTTHCLRAETYYPHSLLADLASHYLAGRISDGQYSFTEPLLRVPPADRLQRDEWGRAYSATFKSQSRQEPAAVRSCYGPTPRERTCCWFRGAVARENDSRRRPVESVAPVVRYLRDSGYGNVAGTIETL